MSMSANQNVCGRKFESPLQNHGVPLSRHVMHALSSFFSKHNWQASKIQRWRPPRRPLPLPPPLLLPPPPRARKPRTEEPPAEDTSVIIIICRSSRRSRPLEDRRRRRLDRRRLPPSYRRLTSSFPTSAMASVAVEMLLRSPQARPPYPPRDARGTGQAQTVTHHPQGTKHQQPRKPHLRRASSRSTANSGGCSTEV